MMWEDIDIETWMLDGQTITTPDGNSFAPYVLVNKENKEIIQEPALKPNFDIESKKIDNQQIITPDGLKYDIYVDINLDNNKMIGEPYLKPATELEEIAEKIKLRSSNTENWLLDGQDFIADDGKKFQAFVLVDKNTQKTIDRPFLKQDCEVETWKLEDQVVTTPDEKKFEAYVNVNPKTKEVLSYPFLGPMEVSQKDESNADLSEEIQNKDENLDDEFEDIDKDSEKIDIKDEKDEEISEDNESEEEIAISDNEINEDEKDEEISEEDNEPEEEITISDNEIEENDSEEFKEEISEIEDEKSEEISKDSESEIKIEENQKIDDQNTEEKIEEDNNIFENIVVKEDKSDEDNDSSDSESNEIDESLRELEEKILAAKDDPSGLNFDNLIIESDIEIDSWELENQKVISIDDKVFIPYVDVNLRNGEIIRGPYLKSEEDGTEEYMPFMSHIDSDTNIESWKIEGQNITSIDGTIHIPYVDVNVDTKEVVRGPYLKPEEEQSDSDENPIESEA